MVWACIPYLLASLVYHRDWLISNLPQNHPLFNQRVWTSNILLTLKDKVLTGNGRNETSNLFATGIPAHIILSNELVKLKSELKSFKELICEKIESLPSELKECMLKNFQINGAIPITRDDILKLQESIMKAIEDKQVTERSIARVDESTTITSVYNTWTWGGKIHLVPQGFQFPKCNTRTLWDLWHHGNKNLLVRDPLNSGRMIEYKDISPYKRLRTFDVERSNANHLSKARYVIQCLYERLTKDDMEALKNTTSISISDELFKKSFEKLYEDLNRTEEPIYESSFGTLNYITVYDKIKLSIT